MNTCLFFGYYVITLLHNQHMVVKNFFCKNKLCSEEAPRTGKQNVKFL